MANQQSFLVCDSSTLTNFKSWAQTISSFFTTAGWSQSSDTGQVNWGTISSVPGTGAYVYEIWQPNDGLTTFYLKVEYGNFTGSANCPSLRLTLSSTTNGAGTPSGFISGPFLPLGATFTPASSSATYECNFFGAAGVIAIMMWRNGNPTSVTQIFCVERSVNSSGSYVATYATLLTLGSVTSSLNSNQQSVVFGVGLSLSIPNVPMVRGLLSATSGSFNGSIPADLVAPYVGFIDQQMTVLGSGSSADFSEGVTFTATVYGGTKTYMPTKLNGGLNRFGPAVNANYVTIMRVA